MTDVHIIFNRKLVDFADDLQNLKTGISADIPEIDALKPSILFAMSFDQRKPQQMFHQHVASKYSAQIANKDEDFFLKENYDGVGEMNMVNMLKRVWKALSEQDKGAVWQHLRVLMILDQKCQEAAV